MTYTYDTAGRRTSMTVGGQAPVTYTYDHDARLRTITQAPLPPVDIQYDAANRRTLLTLPNGVSTEYQYDLASRLTALLYRNGLGPLGELTYQYDAAGNRTSVGGSFARTLVPSAVTAATYDAANRQLTFGPLTHTFDDHGNLLTQTDSSGTLTYTWDARHRLIALNSPTLTASFAYDGLGRRAQKTINSVLTQFRYDGLDAVQESSGGNTATYLRTLGIDEALVRTEATDTAHYLGDALGSSVALTTAGGTPATTYTYAPFGETAVAGTPDPNAFRFTGREDDGTGLYYYRARYYDPTRSRFVSADPMGFDGGDTNLYSYVGNRPYSLTDPSGESWASATGSFLKGVAVGAATTVTVSAALASGTVVGAAVAIAAVGYGAYTATIALQELITGTDSYTGRPLSTEDRIDIAAGLAGGAVGGGLALRPPSEAWVGSCRIAPFGNRTGSPYGEWPHYHRAVPDPARPGNSLPNQGLGRHRPWESRSSDQTLWDRF